MYKWMLPAGSVVFIGAVGQDENATRLRRVMAEDGLTTEYLETPEDPTGTCAVLLTAGGHHRSLVARLGAARSYRLEHLLEDRMAAHLEAARLIYFTGFFLPVSPETIEHLARIAREHGKLLAMNLSAPFLSHACREQMLRVLPFVQVLIGNAAEAAAFAEANQLTMRDPKDIAKYIGKKWAIDAVVITQGPDATILCSQNGNTIELFPTPSIDSAEIVDTNGAGDAFAGGFLSQLVQDKSLLDCINAGHHLAGLVIRQPGMKTPNL